MTYKQQGTSNHLDRLKLVLKAGKNAGAGTITSANLCSSLLKGGKVLIAYTEIS
jgi:hypothetical protein